MTSRTFGEWAVPRHLAFLSGVSDVFATSQASLTTPDPPIVSAFLQNSIFEPQLLREILAFDDPTDLIEPHLGAIVVVLWAGSRLYGGIVDQHDDSGSERRYHVYYFDNDKRWYEYERFGQGALYCFAGSSFREGELVVVTEPEKDATQVSYSWRTRPSYDNEEYMQIAERFGACLCKLGKVVSVGEDSAMVAMSSIQAKSSSEHSVWSRTAASMMDFVFTDDAELRTVPLERLWRAVIFPQAEAAGQEQEQQEQEQD